MTLNLRVVSIAEVDLLVGLRMEPAHEAFAGGSIDAIFRKWRESLNPEAQHAFALLANSDVVAFFMLREPPALPDWASGGDVMTLHNLRVGREHQRMGFGRACLRLAVHWIRQSRPDVGRLMLAVNHRNESAKALYLGCGFADTGRTFHGARGRQAILALDVRPAIG